jgi:1-acyl-sn-glycerol-3-phosphate acyltransferase
VGLDLNLVVAELLRQNITVRGLGHPVLFAGNNLDELGGRRPGLNPTVTASRRGPGNNPGQFRQFGAVQVSPRNYYRVMQSGQNALLFPGGTREVFHGRDEAYQLFWPKKVDFVRTAARFNATIIPLSAVGMADSGVMLLESSQIEQIPVWGERVKQFAANVTAARFDTKNDEESFLPPLVAPALPSRNYFIFGKAVSTKNLDPKDKESCQKVYLELQEEIARGFDDILHAREKDPYKDAPQRLAYERFTGKKAPTFDVKEVNR